MVNKVILVGNLGKDPELRYTPSRTAVASFSLATTERFTDKNGQRQERTEWHNIVAWGRTAELANQYLKKGRSVYIEGRIQTRSYDDRDGNKKYRTEIVATNLVFLGGPAQGQGGGSRDAAPAAPAGEPDMAPQIDEPPPPMPSGAIDDNLPF